MRDITEEYNRLHDHCQECNHEHYGMRLQIQRLTIKLAYVNQTLLEMLTFEQAVKVIERISQQGDKK